MTEKLQDSAARYHRAMHAVQSGISMALQLDAKKPVRADEITSISNGPCAPKHLRTGIDSAMVNDAAIVRLLITKGIINEQEYYSAIADEAEREKRLHETALSERLGANITLA